jgi:hypothetical protein
MINLCHLRASLIRVYSCPFVVSFKQPCALLPSISEIPFPGFQILNPRNRGLRDKSHGSENFSELPSAISVERGERNLESTRTDTNVGKAENHEWRGITRIKGNVGSARDSRELMPMIFLL